MASGKMGEAFCQIYIQRVSVGSFHYSAGLALIGEEYVLLCQREARLAHEGAPFDTVAPDMYPREIVEHEAVQGWNWRYPLDVEEADLIMANDLELLRSKRALQAEQARGHIHTSYQKPLVAVEGVSYGPGMERKDGEHADPA